MKHLIKRGNSTFYSRRFSTANDNTIKLTINSSAPILNRLSELCITNLSGSKLEEGASLNRSAIIYNHSNKAIKFDSRTWAFVKIDCNISIKDKTYNSVACPLFGLSNLLKMRNGDSSLNRATLQDIVKKLGITPFKPESTVGYASLLTEGQVASIFQIRPLEFDTENYKAFCEKFKMLIENQYSDKCLPMFVMDDITIGSDFEGGLIRTVLQQQPSRYNTDALVADFSDIASSNMDAIKTITSQDISIFSHRCVVYCIRYAEHPGYYRVGFVYECAFITRLKQHASKTSLKPIVVFAFEQVKNFTTIHPEQFEIDLQQVIASDLCDSGFFDKFDLKYVRECGHYGFQYNGSEADITRICFQKSSSFLINNFLPLSTGVIMEGNRHLQG
jgi:hypothetical protein